MKAWCCVLLSAAEHWARSTVNLYSICFGLLTYCAFFFFFPENPNPRLEGTLVQSEECS